MSEPWNQQGQRPYGGGTKPSGQPFQQYPQHPQTPPPGYGQPQGGSAPVPYGGYQPQGGYPQQPGYPGQPGYSQPGYPGQVGYPVVPVQPVAIVQPKSATTAGLLAFFFGPIGMLYSTWVGALTMFLINLVLIWFTAGLILVLTLPVGVVWAVMSVNEHNRRILLPIAPPPTTYR